MIDAHRGAFEYDWRTRFHLPIKVVGTKRMSWGEAVRLTRLLRVDPASAVCAAVEGFDRPTPREALVLMDFYDLFHQANAKRTPQPYPRPWSDKGRRTKRPARLSVAQLRAVLDKHRAEVAEDG